MKEETPGHRGWLLPENLDVFHSQLKLFKNGAPGLSNLESCCLGGDDRVWRVLPHLSTNMKHLGWIIPSTEYTAKHTAHAQAIPIFLKDNVR